MGVSIIIPTYKRPESLKKLLGSLINQIAQEKDIEIIVVDDGNSMETKKICEVMRVQYIKTKGNEGPAHARELGSKYAHYEILAFIDDDELPDNQWVKSIREAFKKDIDAVYGPISSDTDPFYPFIHSFTRTKSVLPTGNFAIKKKVFEQLCGFKECPFSDFGEDWCLYNKLISAHKKIGYYEKMLVYHPPRFLKLYTRNYFKNKFRAMFKHLYLKKNLQIYPLSYDKLIIKNLILSLWFWFSFFILKSPLYNKLLIFYIPLFVFFNAKSLIFLKKLEMLNIEYHPEQLILYGILGFINPFIDLLALTTSFILNILPSLSIKKSESFKKGKNFS